MSKTVCPYCGDAMTRGFVYARGGEGLVLFPEKRDAAAVFDAACGRKERRDRFGRAVSVSHQRNGDGR